MSWCYSYQTECLYKDKGGCAVCPLLGNEAPKNPCKNCEYFLEQSFWSDIAQEDGICKKNHRMIRNMYIKNNCEAKDYLKD